MIKKLRTKFILITMCSVFVVLFSIIGAINVINYHHVVENADNIIALLKEGNGTFVLNNDSALNNNEPEPPDDEKNWQADMNAGQNHGMSAETPFATRFFTVEVNATGEVVNVKLDQIAAVDETSATQYVQAVLGSSSGFYRNFRYGVLTTDAGQLYIFVDCTRELESFYNFLWASLGVSAVGFLGVFLLVFFLSKKVFRPIEESYWKQKQFITNASHDIKTPLTIINANTEILESESGANEWTAGIKNEVKRLTSLTQNLVYLAKLDEQEQTITKSNFILSDTICETAKAFEPVALAAGRELQVSVEPNLSFFGNESMMQQMSSLLIDNAIKYASPAQPIIITLKAVGNKLHFVVQNQHENQLPDGDLEVLFDRFYRAEQSRNSALGGHGIGLSVVKSIVTAHKGKITAKNEGNVITFTVVLAN